MKWTSSEAKPKFCELVRRAEVDGPQTITRRGTGVAVVMSIEEYQRLTASTMDFREFLLSIPKGDDLEIERSKELPREIGW